MLTGRRLLVVIAVFALTLVGAAAMYAAGGGFAQEGAQNQGFFDRHDANNDGMVAQDEFEGPQKVFERLDQNGDGTITQEEFQANRGDRQGAGRGGPRDADPAERWQRALDQFDTNDDGRISEEEFQGPEKVFTRLDENNDGEITEAEATRFGNQPRGDQDPAEKWQQLLDRFDANEDDQISEEEWPGRPDMFARLDRNDDGQIVLEEIPQRRAGDEQGPRLGLNVIEKNDQDGDGKLSRDEWPFDAERFGRFDPDGDNFITQQDLKHLDQRKPQRPDPMQTVIQMMDENGDGQVSEDEWTNFFTEADADQDELLSHDELVKQFVQVIRPKPQPAAEE
jgi:Ca2+-binding EF-hand superfamily protein